MHIFESVLANGGHPALRGIKIRLSPKGLDDVTAEL